MEMRRAERAVTDPERIDGIIESCDCCRLGISTGGAPYVVPLNFGYSRENGVPVFYFHCAAEGRKLDLLRQEPQVGFELDGGHRLKTADQACGHSFFYQSVIGTGTVSFVEDAAQKRQALLTIMAHHTGRADWSFPDSSLQRVAILRLAAETLSCKEHQ